MLLLDSLFWRCSTKVVVVLVTFSSDVVGASLLGTSDKLPSVPVNSTSISARDSFWFDF